MVAISVSQSQKFASETISFRKFRGKWYFLGSGVSLEMRFLVIFHTLVALLLPKVAFG